MMRYRNKRTGAVIEVRSQISGKDWERAEEVKKTSSAKSGKARGKQHG